MGQIGYRLYGLFHHGIADFIEQNGEQNGHHRGGQQIQRTHAEGISYNLYKSSIGKKKFEFVQPYELGTQQAVFGLVILECHHPPGQRQVVKDKSIYHHKEGNNQESLLPLDLLPCDPLVFLDIGNLRSSHSITPILNMKKGRQQSFLYEITIAASLMQLLKVYGHPI